MAHKSEMKFNIEIEATTSISISDSTTNMIISDEPSKKVGEIRTIANGVIHTCSVCAQTFTAKKKWLNHMAIHTDSYICKPCEKAFVNLAALRNHLKSHQSCTLPCKLCSRQFHGASALKRHITVMHKENKLRKPSSGAKERLYACDVCGVIIRGLWNLTNHTSRCHLKEKNFVCEQCGQPFHTQYDLKRHINMHLADIPDTCLECGQALHSASDLTRHLMAIHGISTLHQCQHCSKQFASEASLNQHTRCHQTKQQYQCSACGKYFSSHRVAVSHLATHTTDKPFRCDQCPRTFAWRHGLTVHQRWHAGDKPYRCHFCQHAFVQSSALKEHIRTHTGHKPYRCQYCERSFAHRLTLHHHSRQHTGAKPYRCEICDSKTRFTNRHSLVIHMSKLHGQRLNPSNHTIEQSHLQPRVAQELIEV